MINNQTSKNSHPLVCVNTRITHYHLTGVQRYCKEILNLMDNHSLISTIKPPFWLSHSISGHLWEQIILPHYTKRNLLFSPSNTGPLLVKNQVVTIHDVVSLDHPEWLNPKFAAWYQFLLPKLAKQVKKIITISEFSKSRILYHIKIPEDKIAVIPNGISESFVPCDSCQVMQMKKVLSMPEGQYILYLGSLEPRKNLKRVLMAWNKIQDSLAKDINLVIAGAKGRKQVFQTIDIPSNIKNVTFLGYVPDEYLPALYSGALFFIYVSIYEGFGLPILEAMACGTPVLTSNTTAIPELAGTSAFMVNPLCINSIADAIYTLVDDNSLRESLALQGLERAKKYTWHKSALHTWNLLISHAES